MEIHGYVKYMNTNSFSTLDYILSDQLIHNRINTKINLGNNISGKFEFRNRVFYGDQVRINPLSYESLENDNGWLDMSFLWLKKPAIFGHTTIDRAFLDYDNGKFNIRLGRQRINWGINTAWNPNDLFNAYNFADFDYEERPGADALRVQYFTNSMNSIDFAAKMADSIPDITVAGKYGFNTLGYDFQILAGKYLTDATIGVGWAGNIKNTGFKGESTYFHPYNNFNDTSGQISTSISFDYLFKDGWYVSLGGLYNSSGINSINLQNPTLFGNITAKTLMPNKYSAMNTVAYQLSPISSVNLSSIYAFGINAFFIMPGISYSIHQNWEVYGVGQIYFIDLNNQFLNAGNSVFLRMKYSF